MRAGTADIREVQDSHEGSAMNKWHDGFAEVMAWIGAAIIFVLMCKIIVFIGGPW